MGKRKSWPESLEARVYCASCEQWYQAVVSREYYVQHFVKRPDVPSRECGLCQQAKWLANVSGGRWQQFRNWERAAADVPQGDKPAKPSADPIA